MVTPEIIITPENTETLPAPSDTEIIEITEETTASPIVMSETPSPFNTVYTENFEIEPLSNWSLGEGWTRAQTETGFALQSTQMLQRALFNPLVSDTEITFQVRWDAGRVHLHTHSNGLNEYQFSLSSDFQAVLYRNGVIVATALMPEFVSVQWQTITYRKVGSNIEILLNNTPLLQYFETEPLLNGQIALSAEGMTRAQWDEMTIKSGEVTEVVYSQQAQAKTLPVATWTPTSVPSYETFNQRNAFSSPSQAQAFSSFQPGEIFSVVGNFLELETAIAFANGRSQTTPYDIYLESGTFNFDRTLAISKYVRLYGRGINIVSGLYTILRGTNLPPTDPNSSANSKRLFNIGSSNSAKLEIYNVIMQEAKGNPHGAVVNLNNGILIVESSLIQNNVASTGNTFPAPVTYASAIAIGGFFGSNVTIQNSIFTNNLADYGGTIHVANNASSLSINCARFRNNQARYHTAVLMIEHLGSQIPATINITNTSFISNSLQNLPSTIELKPRDILNFSSQSSIRQINITGSYWNTGTPTRPTDIADNKTPSTSPSISVTTVSVDLTANLESADPYTGVPCKMSQPVPIPLPPTPTLADYGVTLSGGWTSTEQQAIFAGVSKVGQVFDSYSNIENTSQSAFKRVFGTGRTNTSSLITFEKTSLVTGIYCITTKYTVSQNANLASLIQCNPSVILSEYTVVHELGHAFIGVTGNNVSNQPNSFYSRVEKPQNYKFPQCPTGAIFSNSDCSNIIFGLLGGDWVRGQRGWGSSPNTQNGVPTNFQQNPYQYQCNSSPCNDTDAIAEIEEAASDMFLNWIYKTLDQGGFPNISWRDTATETCSTNGCVDNSSSGDIRYEWMEETIKKLFELYSW
jgi:hypothetical protein